MIDMKMSIKIKLLQLITHININIEYNYGILANCVVTKGNLCNVT